MTNTPLPPPRGVRRGVYAPVVTPFRDDLSVDVRRFVEHCQWLLDAGCAGLAVFGTNSEATSLTVREKRGLLDALVGAGIEPARLLPGIGACSLGDTVELAVHAVRLECGGVLALPPFYYKGVSDDGLFRYFSELLSRVGDDRLSLYLYHIPSVSQVDISIGLLERLLQRWPGVVAGLKDSAGDWSHTQNLIRMFGPRGFSVFSGSEDFLLANLRAGGAGCITATGNVNPTAIAALHAEWQAPNADVRQEALSRTRAIFQRFSMIPALKAAIAHHFESPSWAEVRPPLQPLSTADRSLLIAELERDGFRMRPHVAVPA